MSRTRGPASAIARTTSVPARTLDFAPRGGQLLGRQLVGQVHGLEIDIRRAECLHHLDRFVAREVAERIARHAQPQWLGPHPLSPSPQLGEGERGGQSCPRYTHGGGREESSSWHGLVGHVRYLVAVHPVAAGSSRGARK